MTTGKISAIGTKTGWIVGRTCGTGAKISVTARALQAAAPNLRTMEFAITVPVKGAAASARVGSTAASVQVRKGKDRRTVQAQILACIGAARGAVEAVIAAEKGFYFR